MQTFLPYDDFVKSAECLDYKRLGKQRVEARQILRAMQVHNRWSSHPAVEMWQEYMGALVQYGNIMIEEWVRRGYINTMPIIDCETHPIMPNWLGIEAFHRSHRSNLLRKNPGYYGKFGWTEPDNLPYFWPTKEKYMTVTYPIHMETDVEWS